MRTWRESHRYTEHAAQLGLSVQRLDDILTGAIHVACLDPGLYAEVPNTGLRCIVTDPFGSAVPAIRVYFQIADDDYLDAFEIELVSDPDDPV